MEGSNTQEKPVDNIAPKNVDNKKQIAIISMIVLLLGAIIHLVMSWQAGFLSAMGFVTLLLGILAIVNAPGILKLKPESWLYSIVLFILLMLLDLASGRYPYGAYSVFLVVLFIAVRKTFGLKSKKQARLEEEKKAAKPLKVMSEAERGALSAKVGVNVMALRCPKCNSDDLMVAEDRSAFCLSCKHGMISFA